MKNRDPKKHWFWEKPNWLATPLMAGRFIKKASELEQEETKLCQIIAWDDCQKELADILARDIQASYQIEGENLDSIALRSSLVKHMNLDIPEWQTETQYRSCDEDNAVKTTINFLNDKTSSISSELLCSIHHQLNPDNEKWGRFRTAEEVVWQGDRVVFNAIPFAKLHETLEKFYAWWETDKSPRPIKAALAHYFFVAIHPFEDGNGRIARMLLEKALSLAFDSFRPYSVSAAVVENRNNYYQALDSVNTTGDLDDYLDYMLEIQAHAIAKAISKAYVIRDMNALFAGSGKILDRDKREIIRNIALNDKKTVSFFDATCNMMDAEKAETAWNDLTKAGIIQNGQVDLARAEKILRHFPESDKNPLAPA